MPVAALLRRLGWTPRVVPYTGYGSAVPGGEGWVRVLARVTLAPQPRSVMAREAARWWRRFFTVSVARVPVTVRVGGRTHEVRSDRGGYVDAVLPGDLPAGWRDVTMAVAGRPETPASVRVVGAGERLGIVSDIDDTVMITALPRPLLAFWNTFVVEESKRRPVPGMAALYHRLGAAEPDAFVVYLSTGAWNVARPIGRFLDRHGYPRGPLLMTDWGPTVEGWFRSGQAHKRRELRRLVRDLPAAALGAGRGRRPARPAAVRGARRRGTGRRPDGADPRALGHAAGAHARHAVPARERRDRGAEPGPVAARPRRRKPGGPAAVAARRRAAAVGWHGMMLGMVGFRRGRSGGGGLQRLGDRELLQRYRDVDTAIEADGDPAARAAEADRLAAEVLRRRPGESAFWYDRGMYAKWRCDWPASFEYNRRALDLVPPDHRQGEPAAWNLGIAATVLRDWATARSAWTAFGIALPPAADDAAPIDADFGLAPVRLNADPRFVGQQPLVLDGVAGHAGDTEVVWGRRLCPARVRVLNVPTPGTGHRHGDVVVHDGDPVGTRRLGDRDLGVFNELLLWEPSPVPTLTATVRAPGPEAVERLMQLFDAAGHAAEDWTGSLQLLCRACSEGSPGHDHHHHPATHEWDPERALGLSAGLDEARALLSEWAGTTDGCSVADLDVALR